MFFDCHTHISDKEDSIKNITIDNINDLINLKNKYFSLGIHPWDVENVELEKTKVTILNTASDNRFVAIGECGLDKIINTNFNKQKAVFELQLTLAEQLKLPIVIHCVKCVDMLFKYLKQFPELTFVIHAYRGNIFQTEQLSKHKVFFSFGSYILKNDTKLLETIKNVPIEKVFFETDNINCSIEAQYQRFSEIANISIQKLTDTVSQNASKVFNISKL